MASNLKNPPKFDPKTMSYETWKNEVAVWQLVTELPDEKQNRESTRGIRGEKSSKDMASSRNLVSTIGALASPKMGTEPGVRKGKRSLLACHTRCKCSMETTHNR